MEYDNKGTVAIWKNTSDNLKAPQARGSFYAHRDIRAGEEIEISLWRNVSDNEKAPTMKGKISDKHGSQSNTAPPADDFDEDIPFN